MWRLEETVGVVAAVQLSTNFGSYSHPFMIIFTFTFTFQRGKEQTNLVTLTMDALVSKAHFYPTVNGTHIYTHRLTITHAHTYMQASNILVRPSAEMLSLF